jgi:hypothetical protein
MKAQSRQLAIIGFNDDRKKAQPGHRQSWAFAFELISSGD